MNEPAPSLLPASCCPTTPREGCRDVPDVLETGRSIASPSLMRTMLWFRAFRSVPDVQRDIALSVVDEPMLVAGALVPAPITSIDE